MIVDLFAGPGGWDEGLRMIGRTDVIGIEWEGNACATAVAAGHHRIQADVAALDPRMFIGVEGLIASPPCQAWSSAGKRKGAHDKENCFRLAERMADGDDSADWTEWADHRSPLVCQPVRWVRDLRPEWVALEEVPAVADLWEQFAGIFRGWGYRAWTGNLLAADYGVPQTRRRRFLIAHKSRDVQPPTPTHAEDGAGRQRWVSMGDALEWGFADEPSCTVSSGGAATGGAEPFANSAYRAGLRTYVNGNQPNAARRSIDQPAPTVAFGHQANDVRWMSAGVTGQGRPKSLDRPADTVTGKGTACWVHERPATTVVGSFRPDVIAGPGHHTTSRQNAPESVRVTVQEAGILQSFPADYPWQGSKTRQYEQVGNAVPPLLAAHVLSALGVGTLGTREAPSTVAA